LIVCLLVGCAAPMLREPSDPKLLLQQRADEDATFDAQNRVITNGLIDRAAAKSAAFRKSGSSETPTIDVLIVSGGADWGAFGAGVLQGWGTVADPSKRRPTFDVVTGVSTGALIAPFAFLGDDESINTIVDLFRHPKKDWFKTRGWFYFLPANPSFASTPGLERDVRKEFGYERLQRIADQSDTGRLLMVNTTDVDLGQMHVWDLGVQAHKAIEKKDVDTFVMPVLASTSIPGAFPPREINGHLFVDGAITSNVVYGARMADDACFAAVWRQRFPAETMPKFRYWLLFNNQMRFPTQVTKPEWPSVMSRSMIMSTQSATVTAIRHLFAQTEVFRLKYNADIEVRYLAVPEDFVPTNPKSFDPETMNRLADIGRGLGADPKNWHSESP
jgi:predicted acylesterase/phospholipase RssA